MALKDPGRAGDFDPAGLESLILRISNEFIHLPVEGVDGKIVETIETLARFAGAVRASVFVLSDGGQTVTNTHEWCLDPGDSQQHLLQGIPFEQFGYYARLLRQSLQIVIGAPDDLPPEAVGERRWVEEHGFRPLLFVPMRMTGELVGALGFYGPAHTSRAWPRKYVHLLEFAAAAILNTLERRRYEDQRRELREMSRAAHLLRLEQALRSTREPDATTARALDALLETFDGARAVLLRSGGPEGRSWHVADARGAAVEPGAGAEFGDEREMASFFDALLNAGSAVAIDRAGELPAPHALAVRLGIECALAVATTTNRDAPLAVIVERGPGGRTWSADERSLLEDIAWRVGDALDLARTFVELQESRARFRAIFDYAPVMIHSFDAEGRIRLWNHDCRARLGWTIEEMRRCEEPLALLLPDPEHRERKRASVERADGVFQRFDVRAKDGSERVQLQADFRLPSGQVITVGHDLTEQVRRDEERQELERKMLHTQKLESLGVLAGGIAHDFNNLLVGVIGNLDLARSTLEPASPAREFLADAGQAALQLADLSRQMLAYSGRGAFVVEPVDLSALVESMRPILLASADKKAALEFELERRIPAAVADPTQLRQVVLNLVVNASEALQGSTGRVLVRTGVATCDRKQLQSTYVDDELPPGDYVFLEVTDTGVGMSSETRAQVFEPFYSTKFAGRGLGLAAVLGIVRGHGGAVKVESEPGRGSTFRLLLPASAEPAAAAPQEARTGWRGRGVVLLADDEQMVREVARRMIAKLGFGVVTATNGLEAVELFAERRGEIVAIVLDVTMPVLDGREALARIRALDADVPVVLASGYAGAAVLDERATAFLQKPFTMAAVESSLRPLFTDLPRDTRPER